MRPFDLVLGHDFIKAALERMVQKDQIPRVILFTGPQGTQKKRMAKAFIDTIFEKDGNPIKTQEHSDVRVYAPESKSENYSVSQIDDFINEIALLPFESKRRFFVFEEAHRMQHVQANRLLKSFEEMPAHAHAILIATDARLLLDTIVSRAIVFRFFPLKDSLLNSLDPKALMHAEGSISRLENFSASLPIEESMISAMICIYKDQIDAASSYLDQITTLEEFELALDKVRFFIRDLHYLKETKNHDKLYYPEHRFIMEKIIEGPIPSLERMKEAMWEAIDGFDKHIKPKAILQQMIVHLVAYK